MKIIKKIFIFLVILMVTCLVACKSEMSFVYDDKDYNIGEAELENIKNLQIEWAGTDTIISSWDGDKIHIYETLDEGVKEDYMLHYKVVGETLCIEPCKSMLVPNFSFNTKVLYVDIPSSLTLDNLQLKLLSTKATIKDINCSNITVTSVTGNIILSNVTSSITEVFTNGGNIDATNGSYQQLNITTNSGVATIKNVLGNIVVKDNHGDINLTYKETLLFNVILNNNKGNLTNEYDVLEVGNDIKIIIEGGSGNIAIKKN